jgi:hypothetical protein
VHFKFNKYHCKFMITSVVKISPGRAEALGAHITIQIKLTRGEVMP